MSSRSDRLINLNSPPFCPKGWEIRDHLMRGELWKWNPEEIELYPPENQGSSFISIKEFLEELRRKKKRPLNANVLRFLLENIHLISDYWDRALFLGTIYQKSDGSLAVYQLVKRAETGWGLGLSLIHDDVIFGRPVALVFIDRKN